MTRLAIFYDLIMIWLIGNLRNVEFYRLVQLIKFCDLTMGTLFSSALDAFKLIDITIVIPSFSLISLNSDSMDFGRNPKSAKSGDTEIRGHHI